MNKDTEKTLSSAVESGDWDKARHLAAIKVAKMMEQTDSPREAKALSLSLQKLIEGCEKADVTDSFVNTPLYQIRREHARKMAEWAAEDAAKAKAAESGED